MGFLILAILVVSISSFASENRGEGSFGCFKWILALAFCFAFPPIVPLILFFVVVGFLWNSFI